MQRLGSNGFQKCGICGEHGHTRESCSLADYYHKQAIKAVLSGRATLDDIQEAYRPSRKESLKT